MLYCQVNGTFMNANDFNKIIKIYDFSLMLFLYGTLILHMKYVNDTLKDKFNLNTTFKPKPVTGPDDLLLLLIQHWAQNAHVFPTENNQHDLAMLLLFQFYTGSWPAKFIHSLKGKASKDDNNDCNITDGLEYNNNSDTDDDSEYNNDLLSDFNNNNDAITDDDDLFKKGIDEGINHNNSYSSDRIDVIMMKNTYDCQLINIDEAKQLMQLNCNINKINEFGKVIQKYKVLCYKDICLWIMKNPKDREQDVLAMKIHLQHHKNVNNKLKSSVTLKGDYWILS